MVTKIEKMIGLHERGLLTDNEVVNDLLLILAQTEESQHRQQLLLSLPDWLQANVRSRLDDLSERDFEWRPFTIGGGFNAEELRQLSRRLGVIHGELKKW